jgi:hypothetical protein
MVWSFLHSFSELLGLWPSTVDELLAALVAGQSSRLLGEVHVGLLRLLQADMEEAHASGTGQACYCNAALCICIAHVSLALRLFVPLPLLVGSVLQQVCEDSLMMILLCYLWPSLLVQGFVSGAADRSVAQIASYLEEAWAWGFDVDIWRAHLNPLTWPEVELHRLTLSKPFNSPMPFLIFPWACSHFFVLHVPDADADLKGATLGRCCASLQQRRGWAASATRAGRTLGPRWARRAKMWLQMSPAASSCACPFASAQAVSRLLPGRCMTSLKVCLAEKTTEDGCHGASKEISG